MRSRALREIETPADDELEEEAIGRVRQADGRPHVELPVRRQVEVEGRDDLMLGGPRAERPVVLDAQSDLLGDVVADLCVGREDETRGSVGARQGLLERRTD